MPDLTGWLFDLYTDPKDGLVLWLLEEGDERTTPRCLTQAFPVTFYAAGPDAVLRQAWIWLSDQGVRLERTDRIDLFLPAPRVVLSVTVPDPFAQPRLFARLSQAFPALEYFDADLSVSLRHAAQFGTFPLGRVCVSVDDRQAVQAFTPLDSPWELDPCLPPLHALHLEPDCDPAHATPQFLKVGCAGRQYRFSLDPPRPLLLNLAALLRRHDPDLLLTAWGDTWLLPRLLEMSREAHIPLPLNRDSGRGVLRKPQRSYFAYGQVVYRGAQVHTFGRWHLDICNTVMYHDYGLDGVLESSRVTGLPVQQTARCSPGTGISAMQIVTALRQGVLVPWRKQQPELPKSTLDLLHADQGGLVYQPIPGLHRDVAEVDFISMYPSIMRRFNISPETVNCSGEGQRVPETNLYVRPDPPGLVPLTLAPLLDKRIALKHRIADLPNWHPRRALYKAQASAHKWLLVTCFGYLGYQNARFGRIEAYQAVTAWSRECLLRAKEAVEDAGGRVLHLYVDGLWVQLPGASEKGAFQPLLEEITRRGGLPIALDGIYRWVAFLPSRSNAHISVANRYFGAFQDGTLKVRGIEARRGDTPPFIARVQMEMLAILARGEHPREYLERQLRLLREGQIPVQDLLVRQRLSREISRYRVPSPAARAAVQLEQAGKHLRPGQSVRFLYTLGEPGVWAWDRLEPFNPATLDLARYRTLLLRAAETVLEPFGGQAEAQQVFWPVARAGILLDAHAPGESFRLVSLLPERFVLKFITRDLYA